MKLKNLFYALLICALGLGLALPAQAEEAVVEDTIVTTPSFDSVPLADETMEWGESSALVEGDAFSTAETAESFTIGELELAGSRRRCNCQDQCFSDTFCQLFTPGKVCKAVGNCGCKKCVFP